MISRPTIYNLKPLPCGSFGTFIAANPIWLSDHGDEIIDPA